MSAPTYRWRGPRHIGTLAEVMHNTTVQTGNEPAKPSCSSCLRSVLVSTPDNELWNCCILARTKEAFAQDGWFALAPIHKWVTSLRDRGSADFVVFPELRLEPKPGARPLEVRSGHVAFRGSNRSRHRREMLEGYYVESWVHCILALPEITFEVQLKVIERCLDNEEFAEWTEAHLFMANKQPGLKKRLVELLADEVKNLLPPA